MYGLDLRNIAGVEAFCNDTETAPTPRCPREQRARRPAARLPTTAHCFVPRKSQCALCRHPSAGFSMARPTLSAHCHPSSRDRSSQTRRQISRPPASLHQCQRKIPAAPAATPQGSIVGRAVVGRALETGAASGLGQSAPMLSQLPVTSEDTAVESAALPVGLVDVNEQQLDLRTRNSWLLKLGDVEAGETAEVFAVNALAPFVINNKLLPSSRPLSPLPASSS